MWRGRDYNYLGSHDLRSSQLPQPTFPLMITLIQQSIVALDGLIRICLHEAITSFLQLSIFYYENVSGNGGSKTSEAGWLNSSKSSHEMRQLVISLKSRLSACI